ncbi:MAG: DUF559 domain-containing protein [Bauldia sp.]
MRRAVVRARALRVNATDAEQKLWDVLREPPFAALKFRRQVPICPYIADFLSHAAKLVVEVDGSQHAESETDARRDAWFAGQRFRVLRFWNHDVLTNAEGGGGSHCQDAAAVR